ncbi:hypothetical protein DN496_26090 [Burkholderia multivorans]|nr:hypothetical protein DN496_26090 [Burkholderia multivorans]
MAALSGRHAGRDATTHAEPPRVAYANGGSISTSDEDIVLRRPRCKVAQRSRPQLSTHARARDRCATLQRGRRRTISSSEVEIDPPLA